MRKKGTELDVLPREAPENFPQTFPSFQRLGVFCVHEENEDRTIRDTCRYFPAEAASFAEGFL